MGRSASHRASGGGENRRRGGRPSGGAGRETGEIPRRPAGENADGPATVRNILPWREMEKKVAMRLAAKAAAGELDGFDKNQQKPLTPSRDFEPSPDSGVRQSVNVPASEDSNNPLGGPSGNEEAGPLSFQVYTVADLDKHAPARSPRMSMAFANAYVPPASPTSFADLWTATAGIFRALYTFVHAHVKNVKPRPRFVPAIQPAIATWKAEAKKAIASLPWKKIAITTGIAFGTLLVLLFIVLTAAELTDDLKPASASNDTAKASVDSKPAAAPPAADPAPAEDTIEIDEEPPAAAAAPAPAPKAKPAAAAKARPATKTGAGGKKKSGEVFVP